MAAINAWLHQSFWGAYGVILVLTAIVYKVVFARPLPLLKQLIVYLALVAGCFLLLVFHLLGFPIIPILIGTVVLMIVARIRMAMTAKQNSERHHRENH
ncbi:hypothetical protein JQC72_02580 [Polycladomyces sp. WAk]|uniref:YlaH-like protein n=1 Tax=Polycladomyces zharkentensis TaxID=2807616 RepID=A0ABS2WFW5_9BACL|nr:YlaH-like family protein [Polycladomyces sp. WAk]MBN2908408.1 hypothetical protein [Polycladomyces sp. WAk]